MPVYIHVKLPFSVVNKRLDFVGPRNQAGRFPAFLSLAVQGTKGFAIPKVVPRIGGQRARIGVAVLNTTNHFNPRDVQITSQARNSASFSTASVRPCAASSSSTSRGVDVTQFEILSLHEKLDELREMKWSELITMQQEQLRLLTQLMKEHPSAGRQSSGDWLNIYCVENYGFPCPVRLKTSTS